MDWSRLAGWDEEDDDRQPFNGFDLSTCLIDKNEIVLPGPVKGGIPPISEPVFVAAESADQICWRR